MEAAVHGIDSTEDSRSHQQQSGDDFQDIKRSFRFWVIILGLGITMWLAALENTVITTAAPAILAEIPLGDNWIWLTNAFFLASAAFQPLLSQLANLFGRRWVTMSVIAMFTMGSGICGGAKNGATLIAGRAIQGAGSGGILMAYDTIVSDLVPLRYRGNYIAIILLIYTIGTTMGAFIGGAIVDNTSWRTAAAGSQTKEANRTPGSMRGAPRPVDEATTHLNGLSPRYLHAAEQVVSTLRDATPNHISDGHPLLANTFWMVAAIQIIQATFAETKSERLVAQSNLDLLRLTLIRHRDFWNTSSVLVQNLDNLEDAMEKVHSRLISLGATRSQPCTHPPSPDEERAPYGRDITLTPHSNSWGGLNLEPLTQGQDTLGQPQEAEMCQNSDGISFDGEIQPRDTTLDGDSSIGLCTDLSMEAIILGVWGTSNSLFYDSDILENLDDFS
ncbi:major facilitator superfamily domain-containing protein [Xylaria sp. FL0043]|nr:major facilitator superfamily domain-containing protein [Xylaria sp. FL0043]